MSRKITIEEKDFTISSLKRKDIREHLARYGYRPSFYKPLMKKNDAGEETDELDVDRFEQGIDRVLELALGQQVVDQLEALGGNKALNTAYEAIIRETYGARGEEKNSSTPGGGSQTGSEPNTAGAA